jgi:hypothetical protein
MNTTSKLRSQSVEVYNDKQWFKIIEQHVQDRQIIFDVCYRREHMAQIFSCREVTVAWVTQGLVFSQKITKLINNTKIKKKLMMSCHYIGT